MSFGTTVSQADPRHDSFINIEKEIRDGSIKIPRFQREFVWEIGKSAALVDSVLKGYPIGTFIFWKTKDRLRAVKEIGGFNFPEPPEGDHVYYIIDGQQRLTSLFATLTGATVVRDDGSKEDFSRICVDLSAVENGSDEDWVKILDSDNLPESWIPVRDLMYGTYKTFKDKYLAYLDNEVIDNLKSRLREGYRYPIIDLKNAEIEVATDVFTRVNIGGEALKTFEIMCAKMYDEKRNFDLAVIWEELQSEWDNIKYGSVDSHRILQLASLLLTGETKKKTILGLDKDAFIDIIPVVKDSLSHAIDYFRMCPDYSIPVSALLPYDALLIPFAFFFANNKMRKPDSAQAKHLCDYFWRSTMLSRYSSATDTKLTYDCQNVIAPILNGEIPVHSFWVDASPDFVEENGWFSMSNARVKGFLCLLASKKPRSLWDGTDVILDNTYLKQQNSRNYHNFYPKEFLKRQGNDSKANHVVNIVFIPADENSRQISGRAPSDYLNEFKANNPSFEETLSSHLITQDGSWSIDCDDYEVFFEMRKMLLARELQSRLLIDPAHDILNRRGANNVE